MNEGQAKRIVVGSLVVAGGISAARDLTNGKVPRLRIFLGTLGAGVVLAMVADLAPDLAGMFALLMLSTAVFSAGAPTFRALSRLIER